MDKHNGTRQFLQEIFPDWENRAAFAGNTLKGGWYETRDLRKLDPAGDCYVSIGAFAPGAKRRDGALEVVFLVIDDVGEKVPEAAVVKGLGLRPTFSILSSAASQQWVYKLSAPIPVAEWPGFFGGIKKLIGAASLDGPEAVHVFRLPMGIYSNQRKPERHGFAPHIGEHNPATVLDVDLIRPVHDKITKGGPSKGSGADIKLGLDDLRTAMSWVVNDERFDERNGDWVNVVGHGLKALCKDDADGLTVYDEWSEPHPTYDPVLIRKAWSSFGKRGLTSKGGKLKGLWQAANPDGFARMFAPKVFEDKADPTMAAEAARHAAKTAGTVDFITDQQKSARRVLTFLDGTVRKIDDNNWRQFDPASGRWKAYGGKHMLCVIEELAQARRAAGGMMSGKRDYLSSVAALATVSRGIQVALTDFDTDPLLLGVPSGVIDLRQGARREIRQGLAGEMVSRSVAVDPWEAGRGRPLWDKFLREFTGGDAALEEWLQVYAGYSLTGLFDVHIMPFFHGSGGNGKGTYMNTLLAAWGEYGCAVDKRLLFEKSGMGHMAPLAALEGKRMGCLPDVSPDAVWDMQMLKQITGGDIVKADHKYGAPFDFRPMAKLMVSGQNIPGVKVMDGGMARRLKIVTLQAQPRVLNLQLQRDLVAEWGGVLRWALEGLDLYWGLGGLPSTKTIADDTAEFIAEADVFGKWLREKLVVDPAGGAARLTDLFRSWDAYRSVEGAYAMPPINSAHLSRRLGEAGIKVSRDMKGACVKGYKIEPISVF